MSNSSSVEAWYPHHSDYYVPSAEADEYPLRQGDLLAIKEDQARVRLVQLVHPTCELEKSSVKRVQIIEVHALPVRDPGASAMITTGWKEEGGNVTIAFAHTFFLPPISEKSEPLYSNFREVSVIDKVDLLACRAAALTHEARAAFIRREIYFKYRLTFSRDTVQKLLADAIRRDRNFRGPKPDWPELRAGG